MPKLPAPSEGDRGVGPSSRTSIPPSPSAYSALRWKYASAGALAIVQVVLASIISRTLDPDRFGQWALIQTFLSFGLLAADFGTGTALLKFASDSTDAKDWQSAFRRFRFGSAILSGCAVAVVFQATAGFPLTTGLFLAVACAAKALALAIGPPLQVEHRWRTDATVNLVGPAALLVGSLFLNLAGELTIPNLLALLVLSFSLQALIGWRAIGKIRHPKLGTVTRLVRFSIPLALNSGAYLILIWIDKVLVVTMLGNKALGLFYAATVIVTFSRGVLQPAESIHQRWLIRHHRAQAGLDQFFTRSCLVFSASGVAMSFVLLIGARTFVYWINGEAYLEAVPIVETLSIGLAARVASIPISQYLVNIDNNPGAVLRGQLLGVATNLTLAVPMILWFGTRGAAYSTSAAFVAVTTWYVSRIRDKKHRRIAWRSLFLLLTTELILIGVT